MNSEPRADEKEPRADEIVLKALIEEIERGRISIYRNLIGRPCMRCSVNGCDGKSNARYVRFNMADQDLRDWIANFAWERKNVLLKRAMIDRILGVLSGRSLRHPEAVLDELDLRRYIENEPLVAAVWEFMEAEKLPRYESKMEVFWKKLKKFVKGRKMFGLGTRQFPGGANILSQRLGEVAPVLLRLGIRIYIRRSDGSIIVMERLDDNGEPSSAEPSVSKSLPEPNLPSSDGSNELFESLSGRVPFKWATPDKENPDGNNL